MILAVLQARLSSSRLPRKALLPLQGEPMLLRQIERIRRARRIDRLVVATSSHESDDALEALCRSAQVECFRGSLDDVLERVVRAARQFEPDYVVRLTGDCPLTDPGVIDAVIDFFIEGDFDYASNALEPTFPDGLDVEVMKLGCLLEAHAGARLPSQREHVTPYIYQNAGRFRVGSFKTARDLSGLRWTVDRLDDYRLVSMIYDALYPVDPAFSSEDILRLLERRTEIGRVNSHYERNEGYRRSLERDASLPGKTDG